MIRPAPIVAAPIIAAALLAALGGCASTSAIETARTGTLPAGRTYALVDAGKYFGAADLPVAALTACLAQAGMKPAAGGETLVQLAGTVRPVRSRLIVGAEGKPARNRSAKLRSELVLGVTDAATGVLLMRASAARVLPAGGPAGPDTVLPGALCGALTAPAAGPR